MNSSDLGALSALEYEQAIGDAVPRERRFELAGALREMGPAFEVEGDHRPSSEDFGGVGGVIGGQGQVRVVEFRELYRAGVEDRDCEFTGLLHEGARDVSGRVIARDVDLFCAPGRENEPERRAMDLVAAVRAMLRVHSGHLYGAPVGALEFDFCPGLHPDDIAAQFFGGLGGGQDAARGGKERSTGWIEVVGVLMMGEEHDVDPVLLVHVQRRAGQLRETSIFTWRRERGIGQPAKTPVLENRRRSSNEQNFELRLGFSRTRISSAARHPQTL